MTKPEELLAQRYGKRQSSLSRKAKLLLAVSGILVLVVLTAIISALSYSPLSHKDISFNVESAQSVEVEFEITAPVGSKITCFVQALNNQFLEVGYKTVAIAIRQPVSRHSVRINTTELAVTGLVDRCELG